MKIIILTDPGAFYAPLFLLETLECSELKVDRIVLRKPKKQKQHPFLKVCAQSGRPYALARSLSVIKLKAADASHRVMRTALRDRPCPTLSELVRQFSIPVEECSSANSESFVKRVQDDRIDLIVSVFFSQILKAPILRTPTLGCLNVHPSFLPQFSGSNPIYWALVEGVPYTGLTIHQMDESIDTGPVVAQIKVPIEVPDSLHSLYRRVVRLGAPLFRETLLQIQRQGCVVTTPQVEQERSYYRHPTSESYYRFRQHGRAFY